MYSRKLQETLDVEIFEKLLKNVISFGTMINQTFKIEIDGEENENEYVDKIEDKDITDE